MSGKFGTVANNFLGLGTVRVEDYGSQPLRPGAVTPSPPSFGFVPSLLSPGHSRSHYRTRRSSVDRPLTCLRWSLVRHTIRPRFILSPSGSRLKSLNFYVTTKPRPRSDPTRPTPRVLQEGTVQVKTPLGRLPTSYVSNIFFHVTFFFFHIHIYINI